VTDTFFTARDARGRPVVKATATTAATVTLLAQQTLTRVHTARQLAVFELEIAKRAHKAELLHVQKVHDQSLVNQVKVQEQLQHRLTKETQEHNDTKDSLAKAQERLNELKDRRKA
jgi:hypothetical protein